jgi:hypothetical protein
MDGNAPADRNVARRPPPPPRPGPFSAYAISTNAVGPAALYGSSDRRLEPTPSVWELVLGIIADGPVAGVDIEGMRVQSHLALARAFSIGSSEAGKA